MIRSERLQAVKRHADGDGHVTSWCASGVFVLVRQSDLTVGSNREGVSSFVEFLLVFTGVQAADHPGSD